MRTTRRLGVSLGLALVLVSHGQPVRAESILVSGELAAAAPLTAPQSDQFGFGATAAIALHYPLTPAVLIGMRLQAGILASGDPPAQRGVRDPGAGTFELASLALRLRPLASRADLRRATGLFLEAGLGGGMTGDLGRAGFGGGVGYGFAIGDFSWAPVLRYLQVIQPAAVLSSADARLLTLGIEVMFTDARRAPPKPAPKSLPVEPDRDHDGIVDLSDKCPDQPEDMDGHDDADGCPDPDNDADGILDAKDTCPDQAEDFDDYDDADGCPESDNDLDGFLDADDQCPNEPEVVNGNKDFDGCPDEGLIVFENDRIVLEERVLFDFERARVKSAARPILDAIAALKKQHPEWISLRIEGHADARGNPQFNQELSERRASHVMAELIKLGIPAEQIRAIGFGASHLRDLRDDEQAHQRNRRVEFVVEARVPKSVSEVGDEPAAAPAREKSEPSADEAKDPKAGEKTPPRSEAKPAAEAKPAQAEPMETKPPALQKPAQSEEPSAAKEKPASLLTPIGPNGSEPVPGPPSAAPPPAPPPGKLKEAPKP